jgi:hypothetical protein
MAVPDTRAGPEKKISEVAISNAIERFLGVSSTVPGFANVLSRMQTTALASIGVDSQEFRNLVLQYGGAQLKEEAEKQQQRQAQMERNGETKTPGSTAAVDALGRPILGGALGMAARAGSGRASVEGSTGIPKIGTSGDYAGIIGNFGVGPGGTLHGFTPQLYAQQFRPLGYSEATAKNVAGILGRNEGLHGDALVARTKEVAHDTKDRLGLEVNKYAPAVANVGRENTKKTIDNNQLLEQAEDLQKKGDHTGAARVLERYNQERDRHLQDVQSTPQKNPNVRKDQKKLYQGIEDAHPEARKNKAFKPVQSDESLIKSSPKTDEGADASSHQNTVTRQTVQDCEV